MKRPQIHRLNVIYGMLKGGRYPNCGILAKQFEVSPRTICRDIDCLKDDFRAPLEYDPRRRGYHLTDPDYTIPPVKLTEGEAVALALGLTALAVYHGMGLEGPLRSALEKLPLLLPHSVSVDLDSLNGAVSFGVVPLRGDAERVADRFAHLKGAIEGSRRVEMQYYTASRDDVTQRRVDPYHLRHFEGAWYLVGFCHLRGAYRTFALDRMQQLTVLDETFSPREDFSPETYFGDAWCLERGAEKQRVVVRFDPYQARWMRARRWHSTQEAVEEPDGSLTLAFTVTGLGEVQRWVQQFGSHVEVLEPPGLRAAVAAEARGMVGVYGRSDGGAGLGDARSEWIDCETAERV